MKKSELEERFKRLALAVEDFADCVEDLAGREEHDAGLAHDIQSTGRWRDLKLEARCLGSASHAARRGM